MKTKSRVRTAPDAGMASQAYRQVLELISLGKIREADLISHRDLASRLGMSKLPVGMALKRLEQEGLVKSVARVGTQVCRIDAESMWGMLQWRVALECQIARVAAEWVDSAEAKRLIEAGKKVDELYARRGRQSCDADVEFHHLVGDLCGCTRLREELERLNIYHIKRAVCEAVSAAAKSPPEASPSHVEVAKAIGSGDPKAAEECMRRHLEASAGMYGFVQWYRRTHRKSGR